MITKKCPSCENGFVPIYNNDIVGERIIAMQKCLVCDGLGVLIFPDTVDRPSMSQICMQLAVLLANRATCSKPNRKIGCVIVTDDHSKILSWGYNGGASRSDDKCDYSPIPNEHTKSNCSCVHAEVNALIKMVSERTNLVLYVTMLPCPQCAKLIVNSNKINKIIYLQDYTSQDALNIFNKAGLLIEKFNEKLWIQNL